MALKQLQQLMVLRARNVFIFINFFIFSFYLIISLLLFFSSSSSYFSILISLTFNGQFYFIFHFPDNTLKQFRIKWLNHSYISYSLRQFFYFNRFGGGGFRLILRDAVIICGHDRVLSIYFYNCIINFANKLKYFKI